MLRYILEAGINKALLRFVNTSQRLSKSISRFQRCLAPLCKYRIWCDGAIIGLGNNSNLNLLDPATRAQVPDYNASA